MGIGRCRAVFLDRDGVINDAIVRDGRPYPPASPAELRIEAGVSEALRDLKRLGFLLLVVTNQPDVARGTLRRSAVEEIRRLLLASLPLDDVLVCYHSDEDHCGCRKPRPGLLLLAASRHHVALEQSFLVGDRWRDIDAGHNAGCISILIDRGYDEREPTRAPDARVKSLREAADWIVKAVPQGAIE